MEVSSKHLATAVYTRTCCAYIHVNSCVVPHTIRGFVPGLHAALHRAVAMYLWQTIIQLALAPPKKTRSRQLLLLRSNMTYCPRLLPCRQYSRLSAGFCFIGHTNILFTEKTDTLDWLRRLDLLVYFPHWSSSSSSVLFVCMFSGFVR